MFKRALALTLAAVFLTAAPAAADSPSQLIDEFNDRAGVFNEMETGQVRAALDELSDSSRYQLFVVFMDSFDGEDPQLWTEETFDMSHMGKYDVLMAVAVQDRNYWVTTAGDIPLGREVIDSIIYDQIEPELGQDNWVGSVQAATNGLLAVSVAPDTGTGSVVEPGPSHPTTEPKKVATTGQEKAAANGEVSKTALYSFLGLLVLVGTGVGVALLIRKARAHKVLLREVNELTLEMKERYSKVEGYETGMEQEVGFAQARFTQALTAGLTERLGNLKETTKEVYTLRKDYDEINLEELERRKSGLKKLLGALEKAQMQAESIRAEVNRLVTLDETLETLLGESREELVSYLAFMEKEEARLKGQETKYLAEVVKPLKDGLAQVQAALTSLDGKLKEAQDVTETNRGTALESYEASQNLKGELNEKVDAYKAMQETLEGAQARIQGLKKNFGSDTRDALRLAPGEQKIESALSRLEEEIQYAQSEGVRDPIRTLEKVRKAQSELDALLEPLRERERRIKEAEAELLQLLPQVQRYVRDAERFEHDSDASYLTRSKISGLAASLAQGEEAARRDPIGAVRMLNQLKGEAQAAARAAESEKRAEESKRQSANSLNTFNSPGVFGSGGGFSSNQNSSHGGGGGHF